MHYIILGILVDVTFRGKSSFVCSNTVWRVHFSIIVRTGERLPLPYLFLSWSGLSFSWMEDCSYTTESSGFYKARLNAESANAFRQWVTSVLPQGLRRQSVNTSSVSLTSCVLVYVSVMDGCNLWRRVVSEHAVQVPGVQHVQHPESAERRLEADQPRHRAAHDGTCAHTLYTHGLTACSPRGSHQAIEERLCVSVLPLSIRFMG